MIISLFVNINLLNCVLAENINPISNISPIKDTFEKKVIVWRFDDICITSSDSIINRFVKMTENVTKYGGYVGWGFVSGINETKGYASPQNLTYTKKNVDKFKNLTSDEKVSLWLHCWNHSWYTGNNGISVWEKDIVQQRAALNYTIWTFHNNFGYYPPIFSAGGSRGNTNTTVVLAERGILLLYGDTNYEPPDKRLRYLTLPSSKDSVLIDISYQDNESLLNNIKTRFTKDYNKYNILQVMVHPGDWNDSALPIFANFTEWVYNSYNLINMNLTNAYNYKHDLESIQLDKNNNTSYRLNFTSAFNPMNITWNEPGDWFVKYANNQTRYGEINITSRPETILLQPGYNYSFELASPISNVNYNNNQTLYLEVGGLLLIITIVFFITRRKSKKKP